MNLKKAMLGLMVASSLGVASASAIADIVVRVAPPEPRVERVPEARRGYVWEPGVWQWNGRRHVWRTGHWERERRGYVYNPPTWVEREGRWHYQARRWDRDGDGVPNSRDRRPDNPNRS